MLRGTEIAEARLTDWRKLAQGLHARYLVDGFSAGARFVAAVGEAGDALGHHPRVSMGNGYVDLKLTLGSGHVYEIWGAPIGLVYGMLGWLWASHRSVAAATAVGLAL